MNRTESFVLWYLRFNGYFATPSFTTHPDFKKEPGSSDADVLAVRFQHSGEYQTRFTFERDPKLIRQVPIDVILVEVKSSLCALNDTWTNPAHENVEYALRWVGRWGDPKLVAAIAKDVYERGEWRAPGDNEVVRFVCFGKALNEKMKTHCPLVSQILFSDVMEYMRERMTKGCYQIHRERWGHFITSLGERFTAEESDEAVLKWIMDKAV